MQQDNKCRLCGERNKTINHIISKCSKLVQREYKTRLDWVGKVIHWELCKKLRFDHMNKWYMHNLELSNSSIWSIDRTLSGATTPGQSGLGSDVNEGNSSFS